MILHWSACGLSYLMKMLYLGRRLGAQRSQILAQHPAYLHKSVHLSWVRRFNTPTQ